MTRLSLRFQEELRRFASASAFLTRVPLGSCEKVEPQIYLHFPLIGALIGLTAAGSYCLLSLLYSPVIATLGAILVPIVLTGALHEDGFADVCDAFGGYTKDERLSIMHDSRIGSFAAIGICLLIGIKGGFLASLPSPSAIAALVFGHAISRWAIIITVTFTSNFVEQRSFTAWVFSGLTFAHGCITGLVPIALGLFLWGIAGLFTIVVTIVFAKLSGRFFLRFIGGLTGDALGAVASIAEVLAYAVLSGAWG